MLALKLRPATLLLSNFEGTRRCFCDAHCHTGPHYHILSPDKDTLDAWVYMLDLFIRDE